MQLTIYSWTRGICFAGLCYYKTIADPLRFTVPGKWIIHNYRCHMRYVLIEVFCMCLCIYLYTCKYACMYIYMKIAIDKYSVYVRSQFTQ